MNSTYKDILDAFFKMTLENSINDSMMEFSYSFPYDGMKEYALEICAIPFSEFIEYIKTIDDDSTISPDAVSQFSNLNDCLVGFCEATDNMRRPLTFEEIGERLQDDGVVRNSVANIKYGENHAKMALHFGLAQCRYNYWYISALGKVFTLLPKERQDALMIRTLLRNKLYASIFTQLDTHNVSIESILKNVDISDSTRTRRLSSIKRLLTWYFEVLSKEKCIFKHKVLEISSINQITQNSLPIHIERRKYIGRLKKGTFKEKYLSLMTSISSLTIEEEKKLFDRHKAGDENAYYALFEACLPAIYNIANRFVSWNPNVDIQDLIGDGVVALCEAVESFDPVYNVRLISYAMHGIRLRMQECAYQYSSFVHLPANQRLLLKKTIAVYNRGLVEFERPLLADEIAEFLDIPVDKIADCYKSPNEWISFDDEDNNMVIISEDRADRHVDYESLTIEVKRALATLAPREADIIRKFFGIGTPEKTLEEIGMEFHLTRERVRQIKDKAIRRLKISSRSKILKTFLGGDSLSYVDKTTSVSNESSLIEFEPGETIRHYKALFSNMNRAKMQGEIAPHKPILMLAIIDYIEERTLSSDGCMELQQPIPFRPELQYKFEHRWAMHVQTSTFKPSYINPIIHMRTEPFYDFVPYPNQKYDGMQSFKALEKAFRGIQLDSDLIQLIMQEESREELVEMLVGMVTSRKLENEKEIDDTCEEPCDSENIKRLAIGDSVTVVKGAFNGFEGVVNEVQEDGKIVVLITIFDRTILLNLNIDEVVKK